MKKYKGIKEASENSKIMKDEKIRNNGYYMQINYNQEKDKVWYNEFCDRSHGSYRKYENKNIISFTIYHWHTIKELKEIIKNEIGGKINGI